jgi:hypothetical protein
MPMFYERNSSFCTAKSPQECFEAVEALLLNLKFDVLKPRDKWEIHVSVELGTSTCPLPAPYLLVCRIFVKFPCSIFLG